MLVEYKHGREAREEIAAAGATNTKQLARRKSTSAESEARQQHRMVWPVGSFSEQAGFQPAAFGFTATGKHFTQFPAGRGVAPPPAWGHDAQDEATQSAFLAHYAVTIAASTEISSRRLSLTCGSNTVLLIATKAALIQRQYEATPRSLVLDFHRFGGRSRCPGFLPQRHTSTPR